ncbi:P-II family nitrogen regulator [Actomonas aquatica]|uniref:P-II family nitrogen regulator n=1 Tax=Actomonas aquatica TaxID=2866162 RepID=A0ABZ1CDI2_9BACT|nr:P-II family nitrogen regulator [Opitutus sp. WL0086]WRQ89743.1 P-II family nitrogen regulator [Opitutus sp. WL0086]
MKLIKAVIKPFKVEAVREALEATDAQGMTVSDVRGMGRQMGHFEIYRGSEYVVGFLPKSMCEIVLPGDDMESIIRLICDCASTGRIGDGKVFVIPVEQAVRIRTGETSHDAL